MINKIIFSLILMNSFLLTNVYADENINGTNGVSDGSKKTFTKNADGSTLKEIHHPDGSITNIYTDPNGKSLTVQITPDGKRTFIAS